MCFICGVILLRLLCNNGYEIHLIILKNLDRVVAQNEIAFISFFTIVSIILLCLTESMDQFALIFSL